MNFDEVIKDLNLIHEAQVKRDNLTTVVANEAFARWQKKTGTGRRESHPVVIDLKSKDDVLLWFLADRLLSFETFTVYVDLFGTEYPVNRYMGMGETADGFTTAWVDQDVVLQWVDVYPLAYVKEEYRDQVIARRKEIDSLLSKVSAELGVCTRLVCS